MLYNENDPKAAAWLRELIKRDLLPHGDVDERSIADLDPGDCTPTSHFFAGIGGWPYALRLAGWPADRPVWTGSCPCQPFSTAGKRRGTDDPRHLWPAFLRLIRECRPPTIFGEQVAGRAGLEWLAGVRADLEALGYAVGAADLCAAGVGAPHIRQRLFWVADAKRWSAERYGLKLDESARRVQEALGEWQRVRDDAGNGGDSGRVAETRESQRLMGASHQGYWSAYDLIPCADGKSRRVESGLQPLAHGVSDRVGLLRGYGNAIVPQVAAVFVRAFMEAGR